MHRVGRISTPKRARLTAALYFAMTLMLLSALAWGAGTVRAEDDDDGGDAGAVFAMTNDATNNEVVAFDRGADGILTPAGSSPTGGTGSGTFENSANGLLLVGEETQLSPTPLDREEDGDDDEDQLLLATNAGSDTVSVFRVRGSRLTLVDEEPSGGDHPISVTSHDGVVYVLNGGVSNCTGGVPNISGFTIEEEGDLAPIPGSTRPVSGGSISGCAQVSFDPSGEVLTVTQRQADKIDTYRVEDGRASGPIVNESTGVGPFGFAFTPRDQLVTTENFGAAPGQGGVASYVVRDNARLRPIGPTVRNFRSDTCWIEITNNGRFAFSTSFQSGDMQSYRVRSNGQLVLLNSTAAAVGVGASDLAMSRDSRFLYARNAAQGTISVFRIENDGSLTRLQDVPGLPPGGGAIGIAAK